MVSTWEFSGQSTSTIYNIFVLCVEEYRCWLNQDVIEKCNVTGSSLPLQASHPHSLK